MTIQDLQQYHTSNKVDFAFVAEVFNKPIWGDMGEDSAQVTITIQVTSWHIHFIRTQSGESSPFDDFVCNVIDEYEKDMSDEELFDFLLLHRITSDFELYATSQL